MKFLIILFGLISNAHTVSNNRICSVGVKVSCINGNQNKFEVKGQSYDEAKKIAHERAKEICISKGGLNYLSFMPENFRCQGGE